VRPATPFEVSARNALRIAFCALLFVALAISQKTKAQTSSAPAAPSLKPELAPLSFFIGQWSCEGEFINSKKAITSRIAVTPDLDGAWLLFRWDDNPPNRFHALELWGYDKNSKQFANFAHDNFGGARLFNSPGWDGDTFTWTGDALASPPILDQRFVIERKTPSSFVISWQTRKPDADWNTGDRLACSR
jgi:hypothetical protein